MFKKVFVLGIDREKIVFALVKPGGKGKIVKSEVAEYNMASIREVLEGLVDKYKVKKLRIMFSESLSYVLEFEVDKKMKGDEEKQYIFEKVKANIPENLAEEDWDYKELRILKEKSKYIKQPEEKTKRVIVFAAVHSLYKRVVDILTARGVHIEAVEPEVVSKKRSNNALIGIAKKKDIKGRDEDVLNLEINSKKDKKWKDGVRVCTSTKGKNKCVMSLIVLLVVMICFGGWVLFVRGHSFLPDWFGVEKDVGEKESVELDVLDKETDEDDGGYDALIEAENQAGGYDSNDQMTEVDLALYSVGVINASGVAGAASEVGDILGYEGFTQISLGNADVEDATQGAVVKLGQEVPVEVFNIVERAINDMYMVFLSDETLEEKSEYSVEIILGESLDSLN